MNSFASILGTASISVALIFPGSRAVGASEETLPVFRASDLLMGQRLAGPNYMIQSRVRNDGFLNHYSVTVNGQVHSVVGNAQIKIRLRELSALQTMNRMKRSQVYKNAVKNAMMSPLHGAKNLIVSPVSTVKGISSGVGTFFRGVGHSLFGEASKQEDSTFKTMLGFDAAKRKFAYGFGIDPYTSFPPVRERLNEISWAGVAGNLTVSVAFSALPSTAGGVLRVTKTSEGLRKLVRDNTPAELKKINDRRLKAMGVGRSLRDLFLGHPDYSPSAKTRLVDALARVDATNHAAFVQRAIDVRGESMAFFMQRWAELIAAYHQNVKPVRHYFLLGRMPVVQRGDGVIIAVLPIDHLAWTKEISFRHATNMQAISGISGISGGEVWIEGSISSPARKALEKQNWVVQENTARRLRFE